MYPGEERLIKERENFTVSIRKSVRDEMIRQKRIINTNEPTKIPLEVEQVTKSSEEEQEETVQFYPPEEAYKRRTYCMRDFPKLAENIRSTIPKKVLEGLHGLRKLLSNPNNNSIARACQQNLYPYFIRYGNQSEDKEIKEEALNCLINSTAGTSGVAQVIMQNGGVEMALAILKEKQIDMRLEAIWLLSNLAVDQITIRDYLIENNIIEFIITYYRQEKVKSKKSTLLWAVTSLCRGFPAPKYEKTKMALPLFCQIILKTGFDKESRLIEILWALSYFCQQSTEAVVKVIQYRLLPKLIEFLRCPVEKIKVPILRILVFIYSVCGTTQLPFEANLLFEPTTCDTIYSLIDCNRKSVRKQVADVLTNMVLVNKQMGTRVFKDKDLMFSIISRMGSTAQVTEVKRSLFYVIYNLAYILNDNNKLVRTFDQYKVMEIFAQSLKEASDDAVIIDILKTLSGLFALGEKKKEEFGVNPFKSYFDQSNGREVLQSIETKQEDILVLLAELENYYDTEE